MLLLGAGSAFPAGVSHAQDAGLRADSTLIATDRQATVEPEARRSTALEIETVPARADSIGVGSVFVGAITLTGLKVLKPAEFSDLFVQRIGQALSRNDLKALADVIEERIRRRGFAFASAWIEPQRLTNGVLVIRVDEGRIDEVRFDGPVPAAVARALAPLVNGKPAQIGEVERRLLLAGDVDGVRIRGSRYLREGSRGILLVKASQERFALRVALTNQGTRPIGPEQVRIESDINGLLAADDSLTLSYSTTPAQPRELQFGFARYAKRINAAGAEVALTGAISVTHPGAYLTPFELRNRSWYATASLLQPLLRRRRASLWLEGAVGLRNLTQWREDVRLRRDQIATARFTIYGNSAFVGGRLRGSATLSQGLGILGATTAGDPLASRRDADGTFTTLSAWSDWTIDLDRRLSLRLAAQGQVASRPLLISEEASLGGTQILRGYDWGERTGDEGVMGTAELRYLLENPMGLAKRAQLYAFVDGGTVSSLRKGFGGGGLVSAGGGMRMDVSQNIGATFELAAPLTGKRYDTGDESPKINFAIVRSF